MGLGPHAAHVLLPRPETQVFSAAATAEAEAEAEAGSVFSFPDSSLKFLSASPGPR